MTRLFENNYGGAQMFELYIDGILEGSYFEREDACLAAEQYPLANQVAILIV